MASGADWGFISGAVSSTLPVHVEEGQGSGIVVAPEKILTCYHVYAAGMGKAIEVEYEGKKYPAKIVRGEKSHDLCLLNVPGLPAAPLSIANKMPKKGDKVVAIGIAPIGDTDKTQSLISAGGLIHLNKADDVSILISSNHIPGGFCGSGLFNQSGELIGINFCENASLPLPWIKELLARNDKKHTLHIAKTEADYLVEFDKNIWAEEHGKNLTLARTWTKDRPESYLAHLHMGILAQHVHGPAKTECYEAAKKAYKINPCSSSQEVLAMAAESCGHSKAAAALRSKNISPEKKL